MRNNLVPEKIGIFVWRAQRNRLPVRVELEKKGIDLDSIRCPICNEDLESIEHVLLKCSYAVDVWKRLFKWWGLTFPNGASLCDLLQDGNRFPNSSIQSKIWQASVWVCANKIWQNRNYKIFRKSSWMASLLIQEVQVKSFEWIANRLKKMTLSWLQ
ncbi:uncharacterized protein [Rutidosis leptorrhynchoides]|uniref:uncharacterized protein n=1 Tax=Rutidosis leptorrhynchoides TaxID=125765 RepID=UPI003A998D02